MSVERLVLLVLDVPDVLLVEVVLRDSVALSTAMGWILSAIRCERSSPVVAAGIEQSADQQRTLGCSRFRVRRADCGVTSFALGKTSGLIDAADRCLAPDQGPGSGRLAQHRTEGIGGLGRRALFSQHRHQPQELVDRLSRTRRRELCGQHRLHALQTAGRPDEPALGAVFELGERGACSP